MVDTSTAPRDHQRADIIAAAGRILRESGADAVTTRAVAAAAGVQAPAIYRIFGDKDGLIDAVAEHAIGQYMSDKIQGAADESAIEPIDALRAGWRRHVAFGLANPDLFTLMNAPRPGRVSPAVEAGAEVLRARVRRVAQAGLLRVDQRQALDMIRAAGNGAVLVLLSTPAGERDETLPDAMLDAVLSTITVSEPVADTSSAGTLVAAFATVVPELTGLTEPERALLTDWLGRSLGQGVTGSAPVRGGP